LFSKREKLPEIEDYITNIIPPKAGDYAVMRPCKKLPGLSSFTCSNNNFVGFGNSYPQKGMDIVAFNVHWIPKKGWRAEKVTLKKGARR